MGAVNLADKIFNFFLIVVKNRMHVAEEENIAVPELWQPTRHNLNFRCHAPYTSTLDYQCTWIHPPQREVCGGSLARATLTMLLFQGFDSETYCQKIM